MCKSSPSERPKLTGCDFKYSLVENVAAMRNAPLLFPRPQGHPTTERFHVNITVINAVYMMPWSYLSYLKKSEGDIVIELC